MKIHKLIPVILILTSIFTVADVCYSPKYGFIAHFPTKHEKLEVKQPIGDMAFFTSVLEEESIIISVNAQRIIAFRNLTITPPSDETIKKLLTINFNTYAEATKLTDIQSKWLENTAFPVMMNSFVEPNFFGEGVDSYESGYWILVGDTIYRIVVKGINKDNLAPHLQRLYGSFMLADAEVIEKAARAVSSDK